MGKKEKQYNQDWTQMSMKQEYNGVKSNGHLSHHLVWVGDGLSSSFFQHTIGSQHALDQCLPGWILDPHC